MPTSTVRSASEQDQMQQSRTPGFLKEPSVNVARPRELTDPYYYRIPAAVGKRQSTQILIFSNWGDELVFDDAQDAVVAGEDWTVDDQKIHHDTAMPRSKTWTIESAQLIAMNDVGMDGMTHSEVVRALKGLTFFGEGEVQVAAGALVAHSCSSSDYSWVGFGMMIYKLSYSKTMNYTFLLAA
ncbi:MAG: hypothetical protein Q9193_001407 [Seirophora villosa]